MPGLTLDFFNSHFCKKTKTFYCKILVQDKTQEKTRHDTRPTAHQDARHALLNDLDFKNPVLCLVRVKVRFGCV